MKKIVLTLMAALMIGFVFLEPASANSSKVIEVPYNEIETSQTIKIEKGDAEFIRGINGELIKLSELPCFSTQQEADQYKNKLKYESNEQKDTINPLATSRDILIGRHTFWSATVDLRLSYTTSGNNNTGYIQSHKAYTALSGVTLGIQYTEKNTNSKIASSGKDIYCYTYGEIALYLLVNGVIEITREPVNMSGTAYVIR